MRYTCKICDWCIEGQTQIMKEILEHEKTHEQYEQYEQYEWYEWYADLDTMMNHAKTPRCSKCEFVWLRGDKCPRCNANSSDWDQYGT